MREQKILSGNGIYRELDQYWKEKGIQHLLLVCGKSARKLAIFRYLMDCSAAGKPKVTIFSDYKPNPAYESVAEGVSLLRETGCDAIAAIGGGSGMDVAKCIKLYSNMDPAINYLEQKIVPNDLPFLAVPTTAGTGSEATRFAVIYANGEKQSVADESCIPQLVVMDPAVLDSLPDNQRKATMLDALCHATESFWSVNSTPESKELSAQAIRQILAHKDGYLNNDPEGNAGMLHAAYLAGKAINLTQTTAGHAMCYKLTSLYALPHGYAAALCVRVLWPFMLENPQRCIDPRGSAYLDQVYAEMAAAYGCDSPAQAAERFGAIVESCAAAPLPEVLEEDLAVLKRSVNPVRLKNHPVRLDEDVIEGLYRKTMTKESEG